MHVMAVLSHVSAADNLHSRYYQFCQLDIESSCNCIHSIFIDSVPVCVRKLAQRVFLEEISIVITGDASLIKVSRRNIAGQMFKNIYFLRRNYYHRLNVNVNVNFKRKLS